MHGATDLVTGSVLIFLLTGSHCLGANLVLLFPHRFSADGQDHCLPLCHPDRFQVRAGEIHHYLGLVSFEVP